jgi:capsid portal protein
MENKQELLNFAVVSQNSGEEIVNVIDKKNSSGKWVSWGSKNDIPRILLDNYLKCSNLQTIVNAIYDYIIGEGIVLKNVTDEERSEKIIDVIEKCILDDIIFGGYAIEGIRSRMGDIVEVNYVSVMDERVNEELTTAYISNKWGSYSGKDIVELPLYDKTQKQNHFIYFNRGKLTRNINPIPTYIAALKSVEILNATRNFHLNNLKNGFNVSAIINLNNGNIKSAELKEIQERLKTNFTGSENAGRFLLINNPDKVHEATVQRLNADNFSDLYQALDKSSKDDLYVAFRINPILVGQNVATGFSKEEFEQAYKLFDATVIKSWQHKIKKSFKKVLNLEVDFIPFKIDW